MNGITHVTSDGQEKLAEQLRLLSELVEGWIDQPAIRSEVDAFFLTLADGGVRVVLRKTKLEYDEQLEDAISDFEIDLSNDPRLWHLSVDFLAVPPAIADQIGNLLGRQGMLEMDDCDCHLE